MNEVGILIKARETASQVFDKIGAAAQSAARRVGDFVTAKPSLTGLAGAARNLANAVAGPLVGAFARAGSAALGFGRQLLTVQGFARHVGGALKGLLLGGIGAIAGLAFGAVRGLGAMRNALEKTGQAAGKAGGGMQDTAASAAETAGSLDNAATLTGAAAEKAKVAFGAFGEVGEGFLMAQGRVTDAAASQADAAADAADVATDALEDTTGALGESTNAATRFGAVMDRLGAAFDGVKNKVLAAIAKAITPALEKLADLMESPEFQKFVDLLAQDLAAAIAAVANWFVNVAVPAISDFMTQVNEAGGIVKWLEDKFTALKDTFIMIVAIVLGYLAIWANKLNEFKSNVLQAMINKLTEWTLALISFFQGIPTALATAFATVQEMAATFGATVMAAVQTAVRGMGNVIIDKLNSLFTNINGFLVVVNDMLEKVGIGKIELIPIIPKLAKGGIVTSPTLAMVGERGNEAVIPLDRLQEFVGNLTGGNTAIYVTVPPGTTNPQAFGNTVGESIISQMRRNGQRLPVLG